MTTLLAEKPLVMSLLLAVLASGFVYAWLQTGKRAAGLSGLLIVGLIPCAWLIAHFWTTDRELIREIIYETADAVEANDADRAVNVIAKSRSQTIARARAELANYEFTQANVGSIRRISFAPGPTPMQAEVELTVSIIVSARRGQFTNLKVPRRLTLRFEKQPDGTWGVVDYDHGPVIGERDGFSPALPMR